MSKRRRLRMPSVAYLVARSYPGRFIGRDNKLPWHIGTDLRNFRRLTVKHVVIMGRKTYESIGRPLPNRINVVLSRTEIDERSGLLWARDPETAIFLADMHSIYLRQERFFIIGGEEIFGLYNNIVNKIWLTDVYSGDIQGDAKFGDVFDPKEWRYWSEKDYPQSEMDDFPFRISILLRRKWAHRIRLKEEFLRHDPQIAEWLEEYEPLIEAAATREDAFACEDQLDLGFEQDAGSVLGDQRHRQRAR